jgi:protein O-mannosyl-transferase
LNSKNLFYRQSRGKLFSFPGKDNLKLLCALILLTVIAYFPVLQADFLWYDDDMMIFNNPAIKKLTFASIKGFFGFENIIHYHPLVYLSYAVEHSIFKLNPPYFHLTNLILHCINVTLVFYFIISIINNKPAAFITAALFAVHPLHVESVAWVTERKDLLYSLFYLSSLICYIKYKKNSSANFYVYSLSLFIFSCLSKAMAVTLPAIMLLIDFTILNRREINIKEKIPYFIIAGLFAVINLNVAYYKTDIEIYSIYERISLVCYSILFYPLKMVFPVNLSAIYGFPIKPGIEILASPVIVLVISGILVIQKKISPYIKFGLMFYVLTVIPVLPILPFGISATADRFSYIPLLGLFYIVAHFICTLFKKYQYKMIYRSIMSTGLISVVLLLSYMTYNRALVWRNTELLMNDVIEKDSGNCHAYYILGNYYSDNNMLDKAISSYLKCIHLENYYSEAYYNLGNAYFNSGNFGESIKCFLKAVEINPLDKLAYNNLGVAYERVGDYEKAFIYYKKSADMGYEPAGYVLKYYGVIK